MTLWTIILMSLLIAILAFSVLIAPGIALIIIFSIRKKRNAEKVEVTGDGEPIIEATFTDPDAKSNEENTDEAKAD